jgi:hypothetical protein
MSRAGRTRGQPDRRHHRQPECEKRGKWGASIDPHGFDAGKKIKGKKRHFLVDTQGLLMQAIVHCADVQDRDGGLLLLATLFGRFPYLEKLFADSAYQGPIFADGGLENESLTVNPELHTRRTRGPSAKCRPAKTL